ncbi:hypothetical protein FIBSPDRAFT_1035291 [Athelia psychrophila]|uniref:Uncharacterized protein n=1 Tax=Athelia psychrophila TaxID=1759441 RepID=A0A166WX42_9AGAM|nr:hypothetical protein FIBSPDRAFT_1035291 [Fibularhizoctonia sp. CBS 109695]
MSSEIVAALILSQIEPSSAAPWQLPSGLMEPTLANRGQRPSVHTPQDISIFAPAFYPLMRPVSYHAVTYKRFTDSVPLAIDQEFVEGIDLEEVLPHDQARGPDGHKDAHRNPVAIECEEPRITWP